MSLENDDENIYPTLSTIRLNVGGTIFETKSQTLKKSELLHSLVTSTMGEIFLDRSPEYFRIILDYLRTNIIDIPPNLSRDVMAVELDYFGISREILPEPKKSNLIYI